MTTSDTGSDARTSGGEVARRPRLRLALGSLALLGIALVFAVTGPLAAPLAEWVVARALPWPEAGVEIGELELRGLGGVTASNLRITLPEAGDVVAGDVVAIDTVDARFALRELLRSERRLRSVRLVRPRITATRSDGGEWWPATLGDTAAAPADSGGGSFTIDRLELVGGTLDARDAAGDLVLGADSLRVAGGLTLGSRLVVELETMSVSLTHAALDGRFLHLGGRAALADGRWEIDTARVVDADGGTLAVWGSAGPARDAGLDLALEARGRGFRLGQLGFSDFVSPDEPADLDATVRGSAGRPEIDARLAFADAGTVRAESRLELGESATLLVIDAEVRALDVARLTRGRVGVPPLAGTLTGSLDITSPDSIEGPLELDIGAAPGGEPVTVAGRADFDGGLAVVALDVSVRDYRANVRGQVRPVGAELSWDVEANGRTRLPLPASVATREPGWEGPWDVTARVTGGGPPDALMGRAEARLVPLVDDPRTGPIEATITLDGDRVGFESRLALGEGEIEAEGGLARTAPGRSWSVDRLDVARFRLGPWLRDDPGSVSASLSAGARPGGWVASARIDTVAGGILEGASGDVDVDAAAGRTRVGGRLARGRTVVRIDSVVLAGGAPELGDASFTDVDPSALSGGWPAADLTGRLVFAPSGPPSDDPELPVWARPTLAGRLELDDSTLGGTPATGGLDVRLEAGVLAFDGRFEGGEASLRAAGRVAAAAAPLRVELNEARLRRIDPSAWLGEGAPRGRISAELTGTFEGGDAASRAASFAVALDSTTVGPLSLDSARFDLALEGARATVKGGAHRGGLRAVVDLAARQMEQGWSGGGSAEVVEAEGGPLALDLDFATGGSDASDWRVALAGEGPEFVFPVDSLGLELHRGDGYLVLDRLRLLGPRIEAAGEGRLPGERTADREADLRIEGLIDDVGGLLALAGRPGYDGRSRFEIRSTGPGTAIRHEARVEIGRLRGRQFVIDSAFVTVEARGDTASWFAEAEALAAAGGRRPVLLAPGGSPVLVGLGFGAERRSDEAASALAVRFGWSAAEPRSLTLSAFGALLDERQYTLRDSATLRWEDGFELEPVVIESDGGGRIEARGRVGAAGEEDLTVVLEGIPVQARSADETEALTGLLDSRLRLEGTAEAPRLDASGRIAAADGADRPLDFEVEWTPAGLRVRVDKQQRTGGRFLLDGRVPLRLSLGDAGVGLIEESVDLSLDLTEWSLVGLEPLLGGGFEDLGGTAVASVRVTGSRDAPRLDGSLTLADFTLKSGAFGTDLIADRLVIALDGSRADFEDAVVRSRDGGELRLSGGLALPSLGDGQLDVQVVMDAFHAADSRELEAILSGDLGLGGTLAAPDVRGSVTIEEATYWVSRGAAPAGLERVELTRADTLEVVRRFGSRAIRGGGGTRLWNATVIDVTVSARSNVWARRPFDPTMAVEVSGDIHVTKARAGDLLAEGTVEIVEGRSYVEEFGRRFAIAEGRVVLRGRLDDIELTARAVYDATDDVTISLDVEGGEQGFSLTLGSEPEMDESDMISYLTVGRPASDLQGFDTLSGDVAGLGADIALDRVTGGVEDLARRSLGLDVVEIRQDGLRGLTLVAGRYASRRLFLGVQQPITFPGEDDRRFATGDTEVEAEYRVTRWLLANLSGTRTLARFFLGVRHAY